MKFEGFSYSSGELYCEGVALKKIANEVGTPVYVYSKAAIINRARRLMASFHGLDCRVFFAVKACSNIHILGVLKSVGCGADIVSGGELFRASISQIPAEAVIFSGVGKTQKELIDALKAGIFMFNVESLEELFSINRIAEEMGVRPKISLRVNPDVDAKTHPHISTGLRANKFGLAKSELREIYRHLASFKALEICGLSCHIGSQILNKSPFIQAWKELNKIAQSAPFQVTHLNLGGGLGIPYQNEKRFELEDYGKLIHKTFKGSPFKLSIEPGRALIGPTAVLLTRLTTIKKRGSRFFYVVDAAMNDLIRPALYNATHPLVLAAIPKTRKTMKVDVVGPVCESADTFQTSASLPELQTGALLAFGNAGAYGMSMSSQYNSRPRVAEVLVEGTQYQVIRSRETYADLIQHELV